jgi:2-desacetyl-2-hydroxyethyl bacteriochlorophyllide A dehydrogenase
MDTMRAVVVLGPGQVEVAEVPRPTPGPYQALAKMEACSFCSSTDVKIAYHQLPFVNEYPCILGHESVGRVVELGADVRYLREGDRLLRPTAVYPGMRLGDYASGWGGLAEYGLVTDVRAMVEDMQIQAGEVGGWLLMHQKVPADMDPADATMLITLKETLSALQDMGMRPGARVLVVGDGMVGLSFARWAKISGAVRVVVAGHHADRLARALELGADATVDSAGRTLGEALAAGPSTTAGERFDFIIDAVGEGRIVEQTLSLLAPGGTLAVYGTSAHMQACLDVLHMPVGARLLRASTDEPRVHEQVLEAVRLGLMRPRDFYTHVVPLARAPEGLELLRTRQALKVVVTMP